MEPAATIIQKFGGVSLTAAIVGVHRTRVSSWKRPREAGGTGGLVPQRHIPVLLAAAPERGVELSLSDFFPAVSAEAAA